MTHGWRVSLMGAKPYRVWLGAFMIVVVLAFTFISSAMARGADEIDIRNAETVRLFEAGEYGAALTHARSTLAFVESALGRDAPRTLEAVNNLGYLYQVTGRYSDAEPLFVRDLEASERVLGPEHPDTLMSVTNLAGLYQATGRYIEAEPLYVRALDARERVLGAEHLETLRSMGDLAMLYQATGRYAAAEPLYARALEAGERVLGSDHPDTFQMANNLAGIYQATSRYEDAEPLYVRALEGCERVLGADHPDTLGTANNLALLYLNTGRYAAAEPLYVRVVRGYKRVLGEEHPYTNSSITNLATVYKSMGRYSDAEPLYLRTLEVFERTLGSDHPTTLTALNNLAGVYKDAGRYRDAETHFARALLGREEALGHEHPETFASLNNLAGLYTLAGRYGEAEPLYVRSLEAFERILGPDHQNTLGSANSLAVLYDTMGRYEEAEPLYARALEGRVRVLGRNHPDTLQSISNLGLLYSVTERSEDAEPLFERALAGRERVLGPEHQATLSSINNLAVLYGDLGRNEEAERLYVRVLKRGERVHSFDHPNTLGSANNLAVLYLTTGRSEEAERLLLRTIEARERVLGRDHPETLRSVSNLSLLYQVTGRSESAEPLLLQTLEARERVLGADHPDTLMSVNNLAVFYQSTGRYESAEEIQRSGVERWALRLARGGSGRGRADLTSAALHAHLYLDVAAVSGDERSAEMLGAAVTAAQLGRVGAASAAVEVAAARLAADDPAVAFLIRERDAAVERLAALEAERTTAFVDGRSADASQLSRAINAMRQEADASFEEIDDAFPDFTDLIAGNFVTLPELQGDAGLLSPGEALIAFIEREATSVSDAAWLAVVVTRDAADVVKLPATPNSVAARISALRVQTEFSADGPAAFDLDVAHALYEALIAPLEATFAGVDHLLVVPDGPLQSLPLELLVTTLPSDGSTGAAAYQGAGWLGERYAITTLPSVSSLRALRRRAGEAQGAHPLFAIADPALRGYAPDASSAVFSQALDFDDFLTLGGDLSASAVCELPSLPQTRGMARAMVSALGAGEDALLMGPAATEAALVAASESGALRDARILAFNTHGLTAGELPGYGNAEPALVLSPPWSCADGPPSTIDAANDGLLTASEVSALDLDADWVLLTACNTAAADGAPGAEPLSGLARAFFYAGARSLLVSHWPAEANATELLVIELFNPDAGHLTKAQRLQRAQNAVRANPRYAHPAYWAAFSIIGEGR